MPLSKIRTLTGNHMVMSKATSPHAFSVVEVDFANVDVVRNNVKADWKATHGFSLTYLPFIARAIIDGLREFPHLNASVGERDLVVHNFIDLGIAVDLEYEGLLAPVIRDAETKRLAALAIRDLRSRQPGAHPQAEPGRDLRRHVHHLEQRLGRVGADDADHQPAAGGDHLHRRDRPQAGRHRRRRRRRGHRHPPGRQPRHELGPPGLRRCLRGRFLERVKEILETKDWSTEL